MEREAQEARDALQAISRAETAARRYGPNNGTVPLVWGGIVLAGMAGFDLFPPMWAGGVLAALAPLAALWTRRYQQRLPVKPLKTEKPLMLTLWGIYHAAVLMGGMALGTHFWRTDCLPHGEWTLMGVLDAAPLFWVGWDQRRRTEAGRP